MSFTHRIGTTYNAGDGQIAGVVATVTGDSEVGFDGSIAGSGTDVEVDVAVLAAQIKALCLYSDQALTIETNSGSAPTETVTLTAHIPKVWKTGDVAACPFLSNVTKLYLTNGSATAANVKIRFLLDSTP